MAVEAEVVSDAERQEAAEEGVADLIFGKAGEEPVEQVVEPEGEETDGEDYEPKPEPVEEGEEGLVQFEYEGEVLEATPKIRDALMKNEDYTQKTQALSAERKGVEIQQTQLGHVQRQYDFAQSVQPQAMEAQRLEMENEQYENYIAEHVRDISTVDIEEIRIQIRKNEKSRDTIIAEVQAKTQEFQQASEQSLAELRNKGTEVLRSSIPGWGEEQQNKVHDYALTSGFTEAEIATVLDPRQVMVLWEASQFRALQQGKTAAVQKVQAAPSIKSRSPMSKETGDRLNLRKKLKTNKSAQDKATLIGEDIASRFKM